VTLTGIPAVDWLVVAAVAITAVGVIWRKLLRPVVHVFHQAEEVLPVILSIAKEFKANNGSSLRDTLEALAKDAKELSQYAHGFKHDFVNRLTVLDGRQELLADKVDTLGTEVALVKGELGTVKDDVQEVRAIVDSRRHPR
jgi:predicted glycoside hydrolase/deacetylase ChbG (UPF0249 family)